MRTIEAVRRSGVGIGPGQSVREAAQVMEQTGVGSLAVVEGTQLIGIVTDRDLVRRALVTGIPLDTRVDAVMSSPVVTIDSEADLHEAVSLFRTLGLRRLGVVRYGQFVGMITVDGLLLNLADELNDLSQPIGAEASYPHRDSSVPTIA